MLLAKIRFYKILTKFCLLHTRFGKSSAQKRSIIIFILICTKRIKLPCNNRALQKHANASSTHHHSSRCDNHFFCLCLCTKVSLCRKSVAFSDICKALITFYSLKCTGKPSLRKILTLFFITFSLRCSRHIWSPQEKNWVNIPKR